ncbi:SH3 domain-containing protein [Leptolyngbya iicbica]|uniref:SH3 domain-containing protein n=2 Tax=Cyanophyceae TaxID=3028117 RepID=A0A4Q7E3B0_9CYAN|nr:SH3 domain-containing protein [Leptolyngbya sp. LK]RZM75587.1 SH3 domain-containing protein [Leptolyngbya sp. LK]
MKAFFLGITKLTLGIFLAFILMSLAGVATARYFMAKLSVLPPKPVYENDVALQVNAANAQPETPPAPVETPPAPAPAETLPPDSYLAVVVQPIGLVMRSGPGAENQQLGGIDYQDQVIVLETDEAGNWLKVRVQSTGQEGWVKAGNTEAINEPPAQ